MTDPMRSGVVGYLEERVLPALNLFMLQKSSYLLYRQQRIRYMSTSWIYVIVYTNNQQPRIKNRL